MSFATPAQVKAMFRNFTTNATNQAITDATIQEWLDEANAVILSRLRYYYDTTNIGSESEVILRKMERLSVACQVDDTLNSYADAQKKPQYCKNFIMMLDMYAPEANKANCKLCAPSSRLPDTPYLGVQSPGRRFKASVTDVAPTFRKGVDTW